MIKFAILNFLWFVFPDISYCEYLLISCLQRDDQAGEKQASNAAEAANCEVSLLHLIINVEHKLTRYHRMFSQDGYSTCALVSRHCVCRIWPVDIIPLCRICTTPDVDQLLERTATTASQRYLVVQLVIILPFDLHLVTFCVCRLPYVVHSAHESLNLTATG